MSAGTTDHHDQPLSEINVTPMVDIMLVLLVIFILLAPMITNALQVKLPQAKAQPLNEPVVVDLVLMPDGGLLLEGDAVTRSSVIEHLQQRLKATPELVLRLNADGMTHYETLAGVMGDLQQAGITRLALAVQPR
ncbi:hypothetical protein Tel_01495 [Candidatus Tenderia electrophaga]|jgi:biopolymer transport protein ExbD|uniref:Biopolymer transporter ExbD n=1 Tax=Candidatus Tenderia electrophaga TaxID=1748243 RepID=A0A0S2T9U0_9GAMM|nr:hypothetical protein Tel_01495 [Candidatus Tenderia electrophaga]